MPGTVSYGLALLLGFLASWGFLFVTRPPPARICGTPTGPPVTAPRITLPDGRRLAYKEIGVSKQQARYKVIVVHPFFGSRRAMLGVPEEVLKELSVYMVSYDRAGYAESDPNPKRSLKSESEDLEALADALDLGPKLYIASISIGGYTAWSCLKYIPHRLAGVVMFAPVTNFWWPKLPKDEFQQAMNTQGLGDKITLYTGHYAPRLLYFCMTRSWLPKSSAMDLASFIKHSNKMDAELMLAADIKLAQEAVQQGIYWSLTQDVHVMFGEWEFDPSDVKNPFPGSNGSVHIWHGDEDYLVPVSLQRYVSRVLPWVHYHELRGYGHLIHAVHENGLRCLLQNSSCAP